MELLKKLTAAHGAPGMEHEVRRIIREELQDYPVEITEDCNGNILVHRPPKGIQKNPVTVVLDAHMDEPSLIVTKIYPDGLLGLFDHGGPDENCFGNEVVRIGPNKVPGLIIKPVPESVDHNAFRIDIGAESYEEAAALVKVGDCICFDVVPREMGDGWLLTKAVDDRAGCYCLVELMKREYDVDLYALFAVQEELGIRGPRTIQHVHADLNLNFEGTGSAKIPGIDGCLINTAPGEGAAIFIQDFMMMHSDEFRRYITACVQQKNIPYQYRSMPVGGSDGGVWGLKDDGVDCCTVGVGHYNCHIPNAAVCVKDVEDLVALGDAVLCQLSEDGKEWKKRGQKRTQRG